MEHMFCKGNVTAVCLYLCSADPEFLFKKSPVEEVGYSFSLEDNSQSWRNLLELFNSEIL